MKINHSLIQNLITKKNQNYFKNGMNENQPIN